MVGHRQQRNVHQTAGKVSWLYGRLSSRSDMRLYTGGYAFAYLRLSSQVDTAGIHRSSHVATPPSRRQRQGKRDSKTMENIRNWVDIRLRTSSDKTSKLVVKPNFRHCTIFDENLVAVHMKKTTIFYNKPVYLGMCILDLSKTLMYKFHYDYLKQKYGDKAKLLFTDTQFFSI